MFLHEKLYRLPGTGRTAMFDWYALAALWFALGRGKVEFGYAKPLVGDKVSNYDAPSKGTVSAAVVPAQREEAINAAFEECTRQLAIRLVNAIKEAVVSEAENMVDEHLIPTAALVAEAKVDRVIAKLVKNGVVIFPADFWATFTYREAVKLFQSRLWETHCDFYGGKAWATITTHLMALHNALKNAGNVVALSRAIDEIYDLEHNTASLASKLGPEAKVSEKDLDTRFDLKKATDYLPYVSPYVASLIVTSKNYL
jgi:hypothetical protein